MKNEMNFIMRRLMFLSVVLVCTLNSFAQTNTSSSNKKDSISSYMVTLLEDIDMRILNLNSNNRYKIYPTENIYNVLKLDTRTGRIEQVQWSLDPDNEGSVIINNEDLSWSSGSLFELYPTQNMFQFLMLDKSNGRTWHIQWGMDNKDRQIRRIY